MGISGDGSITLDRRAFKALASETRVEILKRLDGTQKTVSDLARELSMNKATMFQHLEQLVEVGLVKKDSEGDRATTVKAAPFEAPVQGPPKKWVYYRLTWKGKNVLHPERVKIAIVLSLAAVSCLLIVVIYAMALQAPAAPEEKDTLPPMVVGWDVDPVRTDSGVINVRVAVQDNATGKVSGWDAGATVLRWGISSDAALVRPDIRPWSEVDHTITGAVLGAQVPAVDWSGQAGRYLYLSVDLKDRAGNAASYFRIEKVTPVSGPDLQVAQNGLTFQSDPSGRYQFRLSVTLSNLGSANATNVTVAVYSSDPDTARVGRAAPGAYPIATGQAALVPAGGPGTVNLTVSTRSLPSRTIYVMVDPGDTILETGESDNVVAAEVPNYIKIMPVPAADTGAFTPGMEAAALALALAAAALIARRGLRDGG